MIINLPSTVEMATPNIYADQIEWFVATSRTRRAVISLHTHNDRGTGVAATELALMAVRTAVEGTLFGNGERTGNCDIVTMAMNLFSQGVDPELDFRRCREFVPPWRRSTSCPYPSATPMPEIWCSPPFPARIRTPSKGMAQVDRDHWEVPYLPIDPADVGSSYKETVRVNSQSGKGGVGFILEETHGMSLPREMLVEFSSHRAATHRALDREVKTEEISPGSAREYVVEAGPYRLVDFDLLTGREDDQRCVARVEVSEQQVTIDGEGQDPSRRLSTAWSKRSTSR